MPLADTDAPVAIPQRMRVGKAQPAIYKKLLELTALIDETSLERSLQDLIKVRASQVNGCAYCIAMHTSDARAAGETEQRLYALDAWCETSVFTARERAALALVEAVTLVTEGHVPDEVWSEASAHFDERELAVLVAEIAMMNFWNRIAIASRTTPGT
ncbi:MAG: carboxymuconolactone decarboxylase family protein [Candidatus Dormiibacterota bacterium]